MRFVVRVDMRKPVTPAEKETLVKNGLNVNHTGKVVTGLAEDFDALTGKVNMYPIFNEVVDRYNGGNFQYL